MKPQVRKKEILVVDGYNVINAWTELSEAAKLDLAVARDMLNDILTEYLSYYNMEGYVIYDAYNVHTSEQREELSGRLHIVFTKENQTADSYIEKFITDYKNKRHYVLKVVTNDMAEQQIVLGKGAVRVSARELELNLQESRRDIKGQIDKVRHKKNTIEHILDEHIMQKLEQMRKNK